MARDVILQAVSQPAAHRLVHYATSPHLQAFPSKKGFCDNARELGVENSDYKGSCLVLLQNCKMTPEEFVEHIMGNFLRGYIMRIYWCSFVTESKSNLVSHINDMIAGLQSEKERISCDSVQAAPYEDGTHALSDVKVRFQTFPKDLSVWLIDELPELNCVKHNFSHSIYVVEIDGAIRYGIGKGQDMYLTACDRDALFKGYVARACSKLDEALYVKGIKLTKEMLVLDVGAAPGAWTELLSKRVYHVVAIDPGKLDNSILGENVTHICKKAQDALKEIMLCTAKERNFDLLVCDINKHPVEASNIIIPLLKFLKPGGSIILTLKFHGRGMDKTSKVAEITELLKDLLMEMECIWLLANSIYERTFVGIRR